jgi:hypothetical protein
VLPEGLGKLAPSEIIENISKNALRMSSLKRKKVTKRCNISLNKLKKSYIPVTGRGGL